MKRITAVCAFFILLLSVSAQENSIEKYLSENNSVLNIDDNNNYASFSMLDSILPEYRIFLTGERHFSRGNFEIKWKMLLYLNKKAGVKNLVLEAAPSFGWLLTHYLQKKDSAGYWKVVQDAPQGAKEIVFYQSIYKYFSGKPKEEQMRVFGLDGEFDLSMSLKAIEVMSAIGSESAATFYKKVPDLDLFRSKKIKADSLLARVQRSDSLYKKFFGDNYVPFLRILKGIACDCYPLKGRKKNNPRWGEREAYILDNFFSLLREYPDEKFYGQFGANHIVLKPNMSWNARFRLNSFASQLNTLDSSLVKNKICSIVLSYGSIYNSRELNKYFTRASGTSWFTIFHLNGSGTPLKRISEKSQYLIFLNYHSHEEILYNRANDHYVLMDDELYMAAGPVISYQKRGDDFLSIGYEVRGRNMKKKNYLAGLGIFFENDLNKRLHGYKAGLWMGGTPFVGLNIIYNTNYIHGALYFRPEIGVTKSFFSVSYSWDLKLSDKHALPGLNKNILSLSVFLPFYKL